MTPDNQALLDAISKIVHGATDPLVARMDRLETRMDRLEDRLEQVEGRLEQVEGRLEQVEGRLEQVEGRLEQVEGRLEQVEGRLDQLEVRVETIDVRTSQMAGDFRELRDRVPLLEERIDNGFRALKSDLSFAFSDTRKISASQDRSERTIEGLKRELASLQQRIAALEGARSAS